MKEIIIGVGSYCIASNPTRLNCLGLGSCVAVVLYSPYKRIGGLAHTMLPNYEEGKDKSNPYKYADTSIYLMIDEMAEMGVKKRTIKAKLVGGAQMFSFISPETLDIGHRNCNAAKETLKREKIRLVAEDLGGELGRTLSFDLTSGKILIKKHGQEEFEI